MQSRFLARAATACFSAALIVGGAAQANAYTTASASTPMNSLPAGATRGSANLYHQFTANNARVIEPVMAPTVRDALMNVPCGAGAGAQLQAAVHAAASGSTLFLTPGCDYRISTPDPASTDTALYVNKTLTIMGNFATIERAVGATSNFRIFRVDDPGNLTLDNVTVANGRATLPGTDGDGGGIELNGGGAAVNLRAVTVTGNVAYEGGGGIANYGGTLRAWASTIKYNESSNGGGGLEQGYGSATIDSSRLTNNTADSSLFGFFAAGGGAVRMIDPGELTINNSTVSGNRVLHNLTFGGAIENIYGTVTVYQSPITNNTASGDTAHGGAISNLETLNVIRSPLRFNTANGTSSGGFGGGLSENGGSATFRSSPITNNTASGASPAGGGVFDEYGPVYLVDSPVIFNTPNNCSPAGSVPGCVS